MVGFAICLLSALRFTDVGRAATVRRNQSIF
jgi:hypothetical protein